MDSSKDNNEEKQTQDFIEWLRINGARYPKIKWPSDEIVCYL